MTTDQPAPTYLTAKAAAEGHFPITRGRYDLEPVDGFRIEAVAALAHHEQAARDLAAMTRRAEEAEARLQQVADAGSGNPFAGNERLLDHQRRAQQAADQTVANARQWAAAHTDRTRTRCAALVDRAETQARTLLEDAARTVDQVTGPAAPPEPKVTGDRLADAVALAHYVAEARTSTDGHAAAVHAALDIRLEEAAEQLEGAQAEVAEARALLEQAWRQ